jgi:hypothetical protein
LKASLCNHSFDNINGEENKVEIFFRSSTKNEMKNKIGNFFRSILLVYQIYYEMFPVSFLAINKNFLIRKNETTSESNQKINVLENRKVSKKTTQILK